MLAKTRETLMHCNRVLLTKALAMCASSGKGGLASPKSADVVRSCYGTTRARVIHKLETYLDLTILETAKLSRFIAAPKLTRFIHRVHTGPPANGHAFCVRRSIAHPFRNEFAVTSLGSLRLPSKPARNM